MVGKKHHEEYLAVYIGSAYVNGAFVTTNKEGLPELSQVKRVPIGTGSENGKGALLPLMKEALTTLLKGYRALSAHSSIRVTLASPWHHARIRIVSSTSEKPLVVSQRSTLALVEKYRDEAPPEPGRTDLEAVAVQVRVNGYATALAHPVQGTSVRVDLYESEIDEDTRKTIAGVLEAELPHRPVSLNSFMLAAAVALREVSVEESFAILDVGGEVTDLALVAADGIHYLASYPIGFHTILRTAAGDKPLGDALSRLNLCIKGGLSPEEEAGVKETLAKALKPWFAEYEKALKGAADHVSIPRAAYIVSDADAACWITKGGVVGSSALPTPVSLDAAVLQRHIALREGATYDMFVSLAALFFHIGSSLIIGEDKPTVVVV